MSHTASRRPHTHMPSVKHVSAPFYAQSVLRDGDAHGFPRSPHAAAWHIACHPWHEAANKSQGSDPQGGMARQPITDAAYRAVFVTRPLLAGTMLSGLRMLCTVDGTAFPARLSKFGSPLNRINWCFLLRSPPIEA